MGGVTVIGSVGALAGCGEAAAALRVAAQRSERLAELAVEQAEDALRRARRHLQLCRRRRDEIEKLLASTQVRVELGWADTGGMCGE